MAVASNRDEYALAYDRGRKFRLLIIPALFDEGNKLRKFTADVMRRLDDAGMDSFLPDLPGLNESLVPLEEQTVETWRAATRYYLDAFNPNYQLSIRAGAMLARPRGHGWRYAPITGSNQLRNMLRARVIAAREAGLDETTESLMERGRTEGLELAGYRLSAEMVRQLETAENPTNDRLRDISQPVLGGPGLWLRAEPSEDAAQARALADFIAVALRL